MAVNLTSTEIMTSNSAKRTEVSNIRLIKSKISHGLIIHTLLNQFSKIGIAITVYYWVQEGLFLNEIPEPGGNPDDYSLITLDSNDIKSNIHNIRGVTLEEFLKRLEEGQICFGMKYKDEISSIMWANIKNCHHRPGGSNLENDEAYLHGMYTFDSFRGRNIAPFLRYKCYDALRNMGRDKLFSITEYFNKSAVRYKQKLNARNLDLCLIIDLFNKLRRRFHLKSYRRKARSS